MRVGGKGADDLHVRLDLGVGLVHDPERRLPARDQRERRAHVLGHGEFRFGRGPRAELLPTGTARTSAVTMRPSPASFAKSKPGAMLTLPILESLGAISTSRLPRRLTRGSSLMSLCCAP